jgi:hypothetical protein
MIALTNAEITEIATRKYPVIAGCSYPACQCAGHQCVKGNVTGGIMVALEYAAREEIAMYTSLVQHVVDDETAARCGALVPRIVWLTGWTGTRVRGHLRRHRDAGRVVECKPSRKGGMSRWWPAGLWATMQFEKAGGAVAVVACTP